MNRNESNRFAVNPINLDISRSVFNRDHKVLFSGNVGDCIPFLCEEILPGDTFNVETAKVVRMQPLVAPIMDNVYLDTYYFFVPTRLVWEHWKQFNGENTETAWVPETEYTVPQLTIPSGGFDVGTIADYLGIPPKVGAGRKVSALPFRCYALIMNEFFRDENLMNPVHVSVGDEDTLGVNTGDQVTDIEKGGKPFIACKYHDYFTSCLPGAQKAAGPSVEFALRGLLPVNSYIAKSNLSVGDKRGEFGALKVLETPVSSTEDSTFVNFSSTGALGVAANSDVVGANASYSGTFTQGLAVPSNLFADLNNTSVFDINELRQAFAIQRFYEKQARGGSRYIEIIQASVI